MFRARMRALVDEHPLLHHEFFRRVEARTIGRESLIEWAKQDRHVAYMFPRLIAQIIANLPMADADGTLARMPLVENLWEEVGEGDHQLAHSTLMDALLRSLGVAPEHLHAPALPATREFIDVQMDMARARLLAAIGAFCYGNEYLALREYPPIQAAIEHCFDQPDIRFFLANWEADGRHTEMAEDTLLALCKSPADRDEAWAGARTALAARVRFYDQLLEPERHER